MPQAEQLPPALSNRKSSVNLPDLPVPDAPADDAPTADKAAGYLIKLSSYVMLLVYLQHVTRVSPCLAAPNPDEPPDTGKAALSSLSQALTHHLQPRQSCG